MAQSNLPEKKDPEFQDLLSKNEVSSAAKPKTNGLAIASLVTSLLPILIGCISIFYLLNLKAPIIFVLVNNLCFLAAIILGSLAVRQIKRSNGQQGGKKLATAGIILGILGLIWSLVVLVLAITGSIALINWLSQTIGGMIGQ